MVIASIGLITLSPFGLIEIFKPNEGERTFFELIITLLCLNGICLALIGFKSNRRAIRLDAKMSALQTDLDQSQAGQLRYRRFKNATDFVNYLADRIPQATLSVDDLSWVLDPPALRLSEKRSEADRRYLNAILDASKRIPYREIFVFCDDSKYEKIKELLSAKPPYYNCRYYGASPIPRPVFIIIDKKEVLLYGGAHAGVYCSVRHVRLVESFVEYFQALWDGDEAIKLKEGKRIYNDYYSLVQAHKKDFEKKQSRVETRA